MKQEISLANSACLLGCTLIACAWLFPGTLTACLLSWMGVFAVSSYIERLRKPYLIFYLAGVLTYSIGFYWLFFTIRDFGGFSSLTSAFIFLFYILVSGTHYLLFVFLYRYFNKKLNKYHLSTAISWTVAEQTAIKIFPWILGHSQIAFTSFAQCADLFGASLISFIMFWVAEALSNSLRNKKTTIYTLVPISIFICIILYGFQQINYFSQPKTPPLSAALVQANISLEEKHDVKSFKINTARYKQISEPLTSLVDLIIWPETAITEWVYADIKHLHNDQQNILPYSKDSSYLFGALTFLDEERIFNSAVIVTPDGNIPSPYHKQVLMPFGEYTPLSNFFPWLKDINATAGNFTAGKTVSVFEIPLKSQSNSRTTIKIAPLICYEDVVSDLARKATHDGAELLVNLTNDAWFGDTVAPYQHHLIASFRAIENRRYLLRSTNSGLTAVVNPLGITEGSIAPFSENVLMAQVFTWQDISIFVKINADVIVKYFCLITTLLCFLQAIFFQNSNFFKNPKNYAP